MSYIDGLASGLDTTSIINSLMQLEARPKVLLENKRTTVQRGLDAFASIRTRVSAVRTAADAIASASSWRSLTATSSNPGAVAVTAGMGDPAGSLSFTVEALAASMQRSSADTFSGLDADLGGRTLSIDVGGAVHDFDSAATLGELVNQVNGAGIGVTASTLQVTSGAHRLVLTADHSGLANAFDVTEGGWDHSFAITRAAADARLDVGGIEVTRSSNVISDLLSGATITLKAVTTDPVTVGVSRDAVGYSDKVKALVDAVNAALNEIKLRTDHNAETNQRSSLTGDATARALAQSLTRALSDAVSQSSLGTPGLAGVSMTREGRFQFDRVAFAAAYESDPVAVERLFVSGATETGGVSLVSAGWRVAAGTYEVQIREVDGTWSATVGGETANVTVDDDGSLRLSVPVSSSRLGGLTVSVSADAAAGATEEYLAVGTLDYEPGAARRLTTAANRALDAVEGTITTATAAREARIKDLDRQISAWETRLDQREARLRSQYVALESLLGQLGNQATWLSGQIAGLQANLSARNR